MNHSESIDKLAEATQRVWKHGDRFLITSEGAVAMPDKPRPLITKLAQVMGAVGYVPKSGRNQEQGYSYAREADIVHMIRGELAQRQVMVIPSVEGIESVARTLKDGKPGNPITRVKVRWLLIDGESGDSLEVTAYGDGMDSGDKGLYKALTGCQKYLWMKMLHLPTGDDPEADSQKRRQDSKDAPREPMYPARGQTIKIPADPAKAAKQAFTVMLRQPAVLIALSAQGWNMTALGQATEVGAMAATKLMCHLLGREPGGSFSTEDFDKCTAALVDIRDGASKLEDYGVKP